MDIWQIIGLMFAAALGTAVALFRPGGKYNPMPSFDNLPPEEPYIPASPVIIAPDAPKQPATPSIEPSAPILPLDFSTPQKAFHSTRVLCDEMGLTVAQKNEICATIYGESEFDNRAVCKNRNTKGEVTSIDVGICQINSYFHTGSGKTFPSTDYVVAHPEEAVKFMIRMFKAGQINLWIAHKNLRYAQFLPKTSRMWQLAV